MKLEEEFSKDKEIEHLALRSKRYAQKLVYVLAAHKHQRV